MEVAVGCSSIRPAGRGFATCQLVPRPLLLRRDCSLDLSGLSFRDLAISSGSDHQRSWIYTTAYVDGERRSSCAGRCWTVQMLLERRTLHEQHRSRAQPPVLHCFRQLLWQCMFTTSWSLKVKKGTHRDSWHLYQLFTLSHCTVYRTLHTHLTGRRPCKNASTKSRVCL